jgi:hypothetical protein
MKILHLPTSTAGFASGLSFVEQRKGYHSDVMIRDDNKYSYPVSHKLNSINNSYLLKLWNQFIAFLNIREEYDVYHFNYGTSLLDLYFIGFPLLDFPFYKGKKIITFNGSDARGWAFPVYKDFIAQLLDDAYKADRLIRIKRFFHFKKFRKIDRIADHIFAVNPDLLRFLPKGATFLPYLISNWYSIHRIPFILNNKIKIVHSPTNRKLKGSDFIIKAINKLCSKFNNIEFVLVENLKHDDALEVYKTADIVIDQALIGWYGGFGVEVMKMGKPLAVFIRKEDLKYIPKQMANDLNQAIINIDPFNIYDSLKEFILKPELLIDKSEKGYAYVNKWHDPEYVHAIIADKYINS